MFSRKCKQNGGAGSSAKIQRYISEAANKKPDFSAGCDSLSASVREIRCRKIKPALLVVFIVLLFKRQFPSPQSVEENLVSVCCSFGDFQIPELTSGYDRAKVTK